MLWSLLTELTVENKHLGAAMHLLTHVSSPASVLKRWKLNWCDLWVDGSLCFYKTDSRRELEHRVSLKTACIDVRSGLECGGTANTHGPHSLWIYRYCIFLYFIYLIQMCKDVLFWYYISILLLNITNLYILKKSIFSFSFLTDTVVKKEFVG